MIDSHDYSTDRRSNEQAFQTTFLEQIVDSVTSHFVSDKDTRAEVDRYAAGALKSFGLFAHGRLGMAASIVTHALDGAKVGNSSKEQFVDMALGSLKGAALKKTFNAVGSANLGIGPNALALGVSSRIADLATSRSTFTNASGAIDIFQGLSTISHQAFDQTALKADIGIALCAHGLGLGANRISGDSIQKSPFLKTMVNGGVFGLVAGAHREINEQQARGALSIDFNSVFTRSLIQGGVDAFASMGGGFQASRQVRKASQNQLANNSLLSGDSVAKELTKPRSEGSVTKPSEHRMGLEVELNPSATLRRTLVPSLSGLETGEVPIRLGEKPNRTFGGAGEKSAMRSRPGLASERTPESAETQPPPKRTSVHDEALKGCERKMAAVIEDWRQQGVMDKIDSHYRQLRREHVRLRDEGREILQDINAKRKLNEILPHLENQEHVKALLKNDPQLLQRFERYCQRDEGFSKKIEAVTQDLEPLRIQLQNVVDSHAQDLGIVAPRCNITWIRGITDGSYTAGDNSLHIGVRSLRNVRRLSSLVAHETEHGRQDQLLIAWLAEKAPPGSDPGATVAHVKAEYLKRWNYECSEEFISRTLQARKDKGPISAAETAQAEALNRDWGQPYKKDGMGTINKLIRHLTAEGGDWRARRAEVIDFLAQGDRYKSLLGENFKFERYASLHADLLEPLRKQQSHLRDERNRNYRRSAQEVLAWDINSFVDSLTDARRRANDLRNRPAGLRQLIEDLRTNPEDTANRLIDEYNICTRWHGDSWVKRGPISRLFGGDIPESIFNHSFDMLDVHRKPATRERKQAKLATLLDRYLQRAEARAAALET